MGNAPLAARPIGPGGTYVLPFEQPKYYSRHRTEVTLARALPVVPKRFGARTVLVTLADVANHRKRLAPRADPAMVNLYRTMLDKDGLWDKIAKIHEGQKAKTIQVQVRYYYDLDAAAYLLARVHPVRPRKVGQRTIYQALRRATKRSPQTPVDNDALQMWRRKLVELGIFPAEAAASSPSPRP